MATVQPDAAQIPMQPLYVGVPHGPSPAAFTCPSCNAPAQPGLAAQQCGSCGRQFLLVAGPAADANVQPPPVDPHAKSIKVKSARVFLLYRGVVQPQGIAHGPLDPVTGLVPMDEHAIAYPAIESITVWRQIDVTRLVLAIILLLLGALSLIAAASAWGWVVGALPLLSLGGYALYRAVGMRAHYMRVVSATVTLGKIRFDQPFWRRALFFRQALGRAGIPAQQLEIP